MPKIHPMLWFDNQAEEAANFYVSLFPNSKILSIVRRPAHAPGETGDVMLVEFELDGAKVSALNGGPMFKFSEAFSFVIGCKDQAEIDYYWDRLTADGGKESQCGWLKDKYGFSWQVVPDIIPWLMTNEPEKAGKAMGAVMTMKKLDLAKIEAAANA